MSDPIDLNAIRAARREAKGEAPTVMFGDPPQTFTFPIELPVEAIEKMDALQQSTEGPGAATAILDLLRVLLDGQYEDFMGTKPKPVLDDLQALFETIMPLYGGEAGNTPASEP